MADPAARPDHLADPTQQPDPQHPHFSPHRAPLRPRSGEPRGYASRVIADRRANPRNDLISSLVHAEIDGDRLDHESLIHESLLILIGGDGTTRHVLSGGAYQLFTHPAQRLDRLRGHHDEPERP